MIRSGQTATQRPQPEQRLVSMSGAAFGCLVVSGIAEQLLLLPLLDYLLFFVQRVVARAGGDYGGGRLLATSPAAGAELVGNLIILRFSGWSRFHTPLTFTVSAVMRILSFLSAACKQRHGGVHLGTSQTSL
jgi:hypothetical protein